MHTKKPISCHILLKYLHFITVNYFNYFVVTVVVVMMMLVLCNTVVIQHLISDLSHLLHTGAPLSSCLVSSDTSYISTKYFKLTVLLSYSSLLFTKEHVEILEKQHANRE